MRAYIELLIWTMLFVLVIEMIFPSSDLKKYLKLVLGFMVVYTILSPLLSSKLIDEKRYEDYVKYYTDQFKLNMQYNEALEDQRQNTSKLYKTQLENTIKSTLQKEIPIQVTSIDVGVGTSNLEVEEVYLSVVRNNEGKGIFIPCIKIGDKTKSMTLQDSNVEKEIKSCLKNFYNLRDANIYITVQGN